jgi:hypothetical protein
MNIEKLMKKCQLGCHRLDDANNLLAQCYGQIGRLVDYIEEAGLRSNECTKGITGNKCKNCGCEHKRGSNGN